MKKNKLLTIAFLFLSWVLVAKVSAQEEQNSVSFNRSGISVIFKILATSPDGVQQSFGGVYFTGFDETEKESRVHRILADRANGAYFGYDLIIESQLTPGKFKVSIKPLSIKPPETMGLNDLTAVSLPKYPEDLVIAIGDSIALDVLVNPQTKVNIVDLIKITTKKLQSSDVSPLETSTGGSNSNDDLFGKQKARDFTLSDIKLRLTSPKLLVGGTLSSLRGSEWEGIIEGSIIQLYIPGKGRFIFSLFPQNGLNFQKNAVIENDKIIFQFKEVRYQVTSAAPIVSNSGGGNWNLWTWFDAEYRPDLIFSAEAAGYIEFSVANQIEDFLQQDWRKRRLVPVNPPKDLAEIYQKWFEEVRYIASETEKQAFAHLKNNEEREQFISGFWQRRDLKPETEKNEFRQEYYRRIAYANENFAFGKTAGWLTDRGRIFITHGKPDEIQKTSAGEIWIYKSLPQLGENVRFEFVDSAKNGGYRLRQ